MANVKWRHGKLCCFRGAINDLAFCNMKDAPRGIYMGFDRQGNFSEVVSMELAMERNAQIDGNVMKARFTPPPR
ncbi:hypothetical protein E2542_SST01090 [Spatholobus suberectus]|nr:hypothetical protein E2542_SST01090 [Spatholobus suberectus]